MILHDGHDGARIELDDGEVVILARAGRSGGPGQVGAGEPRPRGRRGGQDRAAHLDDDVDGAHHAGIADAHEVGGSGGDRDLRAARAGVRVAQRQRVEEADRIVRPDGSDGFAVLRLQHGRDGALAVLRQQARRAGLGLAVAHVAAGRRARAQRRRVLGAVGPRLAVHEDGLRLAGPHELVRGERLLQQPELGHLVGIRNRQLDRLVEHVRRRPLDGRGAVRRGLVRLCV